MRRFLPLFVFLLFVGEVFAQENNIFETGVVCPRFDQIPNFKDDPRCNQFRFFEFLALDALRTEVELFQTEILNAIYHDNVLDPNAIAELGVLEIRKHDQCLQDICTQVFQQCGKNLKISQNYNQDAWCREKGNQLGVLARTGLFTAATENQARKERSLLKQKINGLSTRFHTYFHFWMPTTVNDFRTFVEKVYNFIRSPLGFCILGVYKNGIL
ncbi:hypothetical protein K9L63_03805 [Candidatus Gracilibacteria bacterium]|nr:hypothetical protein [Candidatus Gracilibacteria bacterium]